MQTIITEIKPYRDIPEKSYLVVGKMTEYGFHPWIHGGNEFETPEDSLFQSVEPLEKLGHTNQWEYVRVTLSIPDGYNQAIARRCYGLTGLYDIPGWYCEPLYVPATQQDAYETWKERAAADKLWRR